MKIEGNRLQEAISFMGRRGKDYVTTLATKEEKEYFKNVLYNKNGNFENSLVSCTPTTIKVKC